MGGITTAVRRGMPEMVPALRPGKLKERAVYRLSALCPRVVFGVHNNNLANLRRGLVERVFMVEGANGLTKPPKPLAGVFALRLRHCLAA